MNEHAILEERSHRQYPLPERPWKYYQQWHETVFMHYQVQPVLIQALLPEGLSVDTYKGCTWVSLLGFTVRALRPRFFPSLPLLSDFHEVNLRVYVKKDGISGIYFLSLEAQKLLSAKMGRWLIGLPYVKSAIHRTDHAFFSRNWVQDYHLEISYRTGMPLTDKTPLDLWLTERHCVYFEDRNRLFRTDIHHREWALQHLDIRVQRLRYPVLNLHPGAYFPAIVHYSSELEVLTWGRVEV